MGNAFDQFDGRAANPFDEFDHPKPPPEVMPISKEAGYALDPSGAPAPEPPAPLPRQAGADGKPYQPGWEWTLPGAGKDFIPEGPVRVPGQGGFGAAKNAFLGSLEQGMGELVAAPPRIAQGFASGPRRFQNSQVAAMDAIDAGKDVPQDQDAAGYQFMSPEQRAEARASIGKAEPGPIEQGFGKTADEISRSVNADSARGFPVDPEQSKKFAVKLAGMAGGMAPLVVATAIGGLPGAVGVAFGQSYTSTFEDAKAHGADDDAAHGAALGNAAVQSGLMAVPAAQWLGHLAPEFGNAILSASIGTAIHGGTMVGVSQVQALANNLVAQGYDPNRKMGEGIGDDMLEQFALGALIPVAGHAAGAAGRGIARGFDALRQPVADPRLIANVEAQRAAMAGVQQESAPATPSTIGAPPAAPLRPEAQQAPAPIVTPPGPHEVLENIATGKDPGTPKVTPAPAPVQEAQPEPPPSSAFTPPPPSPPGRPAGVDQLPPATFEAPPPSPPERITSSQVQRRDGVGYNEAKRRADAENAAIDAAAEEPRGALTETPPDVPLSEAPEEAPPHPPEVAASPNPTQEAPNPFDSFDPPKQPPDTAPPIGMDDVREIITAPNRDTAAIKPSDAAIKPADYGADNKVFTADMAAAARERLKAKLGRLNAGFDPELMLDGMTLAGYHIEAGARSFAAYSKAMIDDLGEAVRPHLAQFYTAVRMHPEFDTAGMDDHATVEKAQERPSGDQGSLPEGAAGTEPEGVHGAPEERPDGSVPPEDVGTGAPTAGGDAGAGAEGQPGPADATGGAGGGGEGAGNDAGAATARPPRTTGRPAAAKPEARPDAGVRGENHVIEPGSLAEERKPAQKARDNVEAIKLAKQLIQENRPASKAEQAILARYVGWGGLANALDTRGKGGPGMQRIAEELKRILTPEEFKAAASSTQNAHYTAEHIVRSMWQAVRDMGFKGGSVFEPGMGVGNFIGMVPPEIAGAVRYRGVEKDPITAKIASLLYPKSGVMEGALEKVPLPPDTFDMAIGNPPFADVVIRSDPKYTARGFMLHDYFFAKSIDSVRPGGLVAFVTSAGTMNKMEPAARRYMAERAEFVGGVRLPSDAFHQNAGTEVTTDVLFFKRRMQDHAPFTDADAPAWTETVVRKLPDAQGGETEGHVNRYFSENPDHVLGQEGFWDKLYKGRYAVQPTEGDLAQKFQEALAKLPRDVMQDPPTPEQKAALDFSSGQTKDGSYYLGADGRLMQYNRGAGAAVPKYGQPGGLTSEGLQRVRHLVPIRDALRDVFRADLLDDAEAGATARAALNQHYDTFVAKFGPINKAEFTYRRPTIVQQETARRIAREEARSMGLPWNEGSFEPGASLAKATTQGLAKERQKLRERYAADGREFDEGDFVPADMPDEVIEKRPNIAPFMADPESYRLRSIEKYNDATGIGEKKPIFHENILTKEREPDLKSAGDGVMWSFNKFGRFDIDRIAEQMGRPKADLIQELGDKVYKVPGSDAYMPADEYLSGDIITKLEEARAAAESDPEVRRNVAALEEAAPAPLAPSQISVAVGMPWMPGDMMAQFAREHLGIGNATVSHNAALGRWNVDFKGNGEGSDRWSIPGRSAQELFADAMARKAPRVYTEGRDASGRKTSEFDPVATQAAADKIQAIQDEFKNWLSADPDRYSGMADLYNQKLNRTVPQRFDGSYLTTPGISAEWSWRPHQTRVVARIIQTGNTYMAHAVGAGKTSAMIGAGMEMRRLGLVKKPMYVVPNHMLGQFTKEFYEQYPTARIAVADEQRFHTDVRRQFVSNIAQDDLDAVIITHSSFGFLPISDEFQSHLIEEQVEMLEKSLSEVPETDRVTVKKLQNALDKLREKLSQSGTSSKDNVLTFEQAGVDFLFVDEAHEFRKLAFATAQNIKGIDSEGSDKAWDLYTKSRYLESLNPGRSMVMASGTPVTNTMGELYSLQRYMQPGDLEALGQSHFDSWAATNGNVATDMEENAAGGYKPVTRFSTFVNMPELYKTVSKVMDIVTSKELEQYVVRPESARELHLAPRTPELDAYQADLAARMVAIEQRKGPPSKGDDIILNVINDGRHLAIDPRLVMEAPNDPRSKLNQMIGKVAEIYHASANQDFYDPKDGYKIKVGSGPATQMIFSNMGVNPRGPMGFHAYGWIKQELVRQGVKPSEIAFIGDYGSMIKRQALFNDMNQGKVRVLIGSVKKMGTGVNAQKQLLALHNLDPLWYPADDEQRVGRILRQGNMNPRIQVHDWSTKGTYDSSMWGMMARKGGFIEQFFRGDPNLREMEDIGEAGMYAQAKAMSTTDERIIHLTEMKEQLKQAERREQAYDREQYETKAGIDRQNWNEQFYGEQGAHAATDVANRIDTRGDKFRMTIGTQEFAKRAEAAEAMKTMANNSLENLPKGNAKIIGAVGGFPIQVYRTHGDAMQLSLKLAGGRDVSIGGKDWEGVVASAEIKIRNLDDAVEYNSKQVQQAQERRASLSKEMGKPFDRSQVVKLASQVREFENMLKAEGEAKNRAAKGEAPPPEEPDDSQFARRKKGQPPAEVPAAAGDPRATEAQARLADAMTGMMRFVGLPESVGLKLADKISAGAGAADAKYGKGLITFAMDTTADAPMKLFHEAAHALMDPDLGLLNPAERKALLTGADRWLNDGRKGVDRRAKLKGEGYSPGEMREEAIGRMAEEALARGIQPRSAMAGAIEKLQNVGRGLGQALRGQGFKTADDVFNGLMRGEKAAPGALEGTAPALAAATAARQSPPEKQSPVEGQPPEDKIEPNKSITVPDVPAEGQAAMRAKLDEAFAPEGDQKAMQDVIGDRSQEQFARRAQDRTMMETAHEAADGIKLLFSPTSRGVGAKDQELLIRGRTAMKAQSAAITAHALEKFRHVVGRLTPDEQIDLTDRMETGSPQPTPQLQEVADAIRGQLDKWTARIQSLGTGKLEDANEFYMGRAYSNYDDWVANRQPTNAQAQQIAALRGAVGAGISKRPITGSGNFLKARSFEYLKDAIQAGLIPVTTNPIEMQTLKLREMQQYYHGAKLAEEMKATGLARWVPVEGYRTAEALGMKELDDKVFKPKVPAAAVGAGHGLIEHGKWMGPGTAADVFNNFVSTGFGGNVIYDAARQLNNAINTLQLGLSGFHATFIAKDAMTSRVALGLSQVMRGDLGRGIVNTALGFSPHTIATTIAKGSQLRSAYLDPQNATPEWRKLAAALNAGGGRIGMDQFYRASDAGSFFHNLRDVANPDGAFREAVAMVKNTPLTSPFRIATRVLDTITHPLMGEMVPRAKLGVFADLAADWQRRNPTATPEQTAQAMTKFWDSVDNRMGQLVYDNLFWRKAMKDTAFVMTRSVGWNLGTIRELGGSVVDAGRAANALAHGRSPELTTRMAYAMAMPLVTMLYGGLLTYAYTGKAPEEIKDYFYPATGKVVNGIKQRLMLPGYEKDVLAYSNDPLQTLANKTGPAINMALEIGKNRDFYGGVIYDKARDNPLIAYPEYLMNQAIPFTGKAMMKNAARPGGASMMDQALAFWGIQPAGASITNPERGAKFQAQQAVAAYKRRAKEQDRIRITGE